MGESSDLEIQSVLNGILRTDLHRSFDAGTWVLIVKVLSELR
jgi:hypothetical protein